MHPQLLEKELAEAVIFDQSLYGKQPLVWKEVNISVDYKKGNRKQPENYRPVSLACIPCKILQSDRAHSVASIFDALESFVRAAL